MTDNERRESMLIELKLDYISYDNLHADNEHGCRVIESALKKQVPMKPVVRIDSEDWKKFEKRLYPEKYKEYKYYYCPECDASVEVCGLRDNCCSCCGQTIDWSEVE